MMWKSNRLTVLLAGAMLFTVAAAAQGFQDLEKAVVEKTLPNGLKVLLLPRPGAPVISMVVYADVGGVNENQNATGLAHIFEHMAFKGTKIVGTNDPVKEAEAMKKVDEAFAALRAERFRRPRPDEAKLKELEAAVRKAEDEADKYVIPNEFTQITERAGAYGLNAFTAFDQTVYMYSLPSNKLELWAALESDRFTDPILRQFYKEKDVIMEEKRMGESQPTSRLIDDFFPVAYKQHMYRSFVIGNMADLQNITRAQAMEWFDKYYRAKNLTAVVVGDLDPATAMPIIEKYMGRIPSGREPEPVVTVEPPQRAEKRIIMEDPAQPFLIIGYHRPDANDPDYSVYEALSDILGGGRSSRLYKSLVKEKKLALQAGSSATVEGEKYPGIFLVYAVPNKGKTNAECEAAIYEEIENMKAEPVTADELAGVKARAKVKFIEGIDSNMGLAMNLAMADNIKGNWRELFKVLDQIDRVTADDIMRVAKKTFVKSNRTVGMIETVSEKGGDK